MGIKVQVPVGTLPFAGPYIRGRNGDFEITGLRIHQWGQDDPQGDGAVDVHGIGKRGEPIVGGFRCLMAQDIDALCKAWIEARGGLAIMLGDDDVSAVVNVSGGVINHVAIGRNWDEPNVDDRRKWGIAILPTGEYHVRRIQLLPTPEQGSQEQ